jgi:calcineurin-like phosphoesterase family protein
MTQESSIWKRFLDLIKTYLFPERGEFEEISEPEITPEPEQRRIFVISDTHFNHKNIITLTGRPFPTVKEMNRTIIRKWNQTVRPQDTIYFLGDFAWSHIGYFMTRLIGHKIFITGNHDKRLRHTRDSEIVEYDGYKFLMIHNPRYQPPDFDGWVIHGHVHNVSWDRHPYINRVMRRVNVSVEMIGYRPVSLHRIIETIHFMEQYGHEVMATRKHAAWLKKKAMGGYV